MFSIRPMRYYHVKARCLWFVVSIGFDLPETANRYLPMYGYVSFGLRKFPKPGQRVIDLVYRSRTRRITLFWVGRISVPRLPENV